MSVHALNVQRMPLIKHGREASNGVSRLGESLDSYIHSIYEARYQRYPREELGNEIVEEGVGKWSKIPMKIS